VKFEELSLPAALLEGLVARGFIEALPVQAAALPPILAGRDVLVRSETGSGKTLAFGLGALARLSPGSNVQVLVLCPTRELAQQVAGELRTLARRMPNVKVLELCGGVPFAPQRASLRQGAHVVVGTPGRLDEHLRKASLSLGSLAVLVLDEADRMLEMGFEPQLARVLEHAPPERQTLLFSATYPDAIAELSGRWQRGALRLNVDAPVASEADENRAAAVEQRFFGVASGEQRAAFTAWLERERPEAALVFCSTRADCQALGEALRARGWAAASIHGEMGQRERQHVMRLFANGSCSVLAATDVAARGWDIAGLPVVVNLGLSRDPALHLHRSGRTGRLGQPGRVVSFVSDEDRHALAALERRAGQPIVLEPAPSAPPSSAPPRPRHQTLLLGAGRNKKLRAGDVLGALTGEGGVAGSDVGSIQIDESSTYVAVAAELAPRALSRLEAAGVKGKRIKVRLAGLSLRDDEG
jgi:ATP-independent RNA helicase DbpA